MEKQQPDQLKYDGVIPLTTRKGTRADTLPGPEHRLGDPREKLERHEWMFDPEFGLALMKAYDPGKKMCEDAAYVEKRAQIACVCDGVGSGIAGDVASKTVMDLLRNPGIVNEVPSLEPLFAEHETPQTQETIEQAIENFLSHADLRVRETFEEVEIQKKILAKFSELGLQAGSHEANELYEHYKTNHLTTCVLFKGWRGADGREFITVGNVGDSRLYRRRKGTLERMTSDDTMVEPFRKHGIIKDNGDGGQLITLEHVNSLLRRTDVSLEDSLKALTLQQKIGRDNATETSVADIAHLVLNSLGETRTALQPFHCEIHTEEVQEGDEFYLCTDGVENYTDEELERFLERQKAEKMDVQQLSQEIIHQGNSLYRKDDDFAVVVVRYTKGKFIYSKERLDKDHDPL